MMCFKITHAHFDFLWNPQWSEIKRLGENSRAVEGFLCPLRTRSVQIFRWPIFIPPNWISLPTQPRPIVKELCEVAVWSLFLGIPW